MYILESKDEEEIDTTTKEVSSLYQLKRKTRMTTI